MAIRRKKVSRSRRTTTTNSDTSEDPSWVLELWVKEPPAGFTPIEDLGKLPSPYTTEIDKELSFETCMLLTMRRRQFKKTKNPIFAIEAFLIARESKLFPPMWVLNWLGEAFKKYHSGQGTQSLEKMFGLVPGRGQSPLFKALGEEERDEMLALDVWRLRTLFNVSIETAATMVSRRLEETPDWNKSRYALHALSAKTIEDRYKKKWKKLLDLPDLRHRYLSSLTKMEADEYLKSFPPDSYKPEEIRPSILK